jgi:chromate transporter
MIFLELLLGFLEVGCFSFGGAYAAIPLIRDVVQRYGWLDEETLVYFIAVSESTPGPIMVNLATYVGSSQGGFLGAVVATVAVVLPAFLIILAVVAVMQHFLKNPVVKALMGGLKPCVVGIVLATGGYMVLSNVTAGLSGVDWRAAAITGALVAVTLLWKTVTKKKLSPILFIVISAVAGIVVYGI